MSQLQESATLATNRYDSNLLLGNLQKYQMMNIANKRPSNEQTSITVKSEIITGSENLKLLGVTIDSRLNFSEHINSVCKKASHTLGSEVQRAVRQLTEGIDTYNSINRQFSPPPPPPPPPPAPSLTDYLLLSFVYFM